MRGRVVAMHYYILHHKGGSNAEGIIYPGDLQIVACTLVQKNKGQKEFGRWLKSKIMNDEEGWANQFVRQDMT